MHDIAWIKLYTGIFDDEKLKFIESMENRDTIECILIKLYIQAAKTNDKGFIYFNKNTPYTNEMFSILFNRPLGAIESTFKVLSDFKMIEIDENKFIRISNWEKYQNVESMERVRSLNRDRARNHRAKKKENSSAKIDSDNDLNTQISEGINSDKIEKSALDISNEGNIERYINEISHAENSNVTVTQQKENKIEKKNEIKNKIEIENKSKMEINSEDESSEKNGIQSNKINECIQEVNVDTTDSKSLSLKTKKQKNEQAANELLDYYKKNSTKIIGLNLPALKKSISVHGKDNAKFAIDKALELNKPNMQYINGILKNWKREGYPALDDSENNKKAREAKALRFNNFKPREYDYDSLEKALLGWDKSE